MSKICYIPKTFQGKTLDIIATAETICDDYSAQGYSLTLRQLYYQFVSRGLLPNNDQSYNRLGAIINDARLAGLIDWNHITDRTRYLRSVGGWESPESIIRASANQFHRDYWTVSGQTFRPEVWVEKDALVDVVERACARYNVPFFSCRGYVSQSEMHSAGLRMLRHKKAGMKPVVIHLGDHDPSGIDMTRDIGSRLSMFAGWIPVERIALTMDQVEQYNPPPNPAKLTDARAAGYVEEYGYTSWELDALEPSVLDALIQSAVEPYVDTDSWHEAEAEDLEQRERMTSVAERWDDISERWEEIEELLA